MSKAAQAPAPFAPGDLVTWTRSTNTGPERYTGTIAYTTPAEASVELTTGGRRLAMLDELERI